MEILAEIPWKFSTLGHHLIRLFLLLKRKKTNRLFTTAVVSRRGSIRILPRSGPSQEVDVRSEKNKQRLQFCIKIPQIL